MIHQPRRFVTLVTALVCLLPLTRANAQRVQQSDFVIAQQSASVEAQAFAQRPFAADTVFLRVRREPLGAGILSYFVPGMGSFYAGNTRHGVIHFGVVLASVGLILQAPVDESDANDGKIGWQSRALLSANLLNWGWSIVSAVNDARANNAPPLRIVP